MKKTFITAEELKKILKFAIKIDVELGFYISFNCRYIEIDQYSNKCPEKVQKYYYAPEEMHTIFTHITAYQRLYKHKSHLV